MRYRKLTEEAQRSMLEHRVLELEGQHYDLALTLRLMKSAIDDGDDSEETATTVAQLQRQQQTIERGIAELRATTSPNRQARRRKGPASKED